MWKARSTCCLGCWCNPGTVSTQPAQKAMTTETRHRNRQSQHGKSQPDAVFPTKDTTCTVLIFRWARAVLKHGAAHACKPRPLTALQHAHNHACLLSCSTSLIQAARKGPARRAAALRPLARARAGSRSQAARTGPARRAAAPRPLARARAGSPARRRRPP